MREAARVPLVASARHGLRTAKLADGTRTAAIIPPAIPGSIGDAAMISATIGELRSLGFSKIDLFFDGAWPLDEHVDECIATTGFFYGAGVREQAILIRRLALYSHVFLIGADVIDGAYNPGSVVRRISLLTEAAKTGRRCVVLGSSYNAHPNERARRALAIASKQITICARDPLSSARLERAIGLPVRQCADLAFLLKPRPEQPSAEDALSWIRQRKATGDRILAININYLQVQYRANLVDAYRWFAKTLTEFDVSFLLVPHDSRTAEPDAHHLRSMINGWTPDMLARTHLLETDSPGAVKAALAEVDLLVTGRLHAMILAMGCGTPALGLVYQGKFEGMLSLFGVEPSDHTMSPDEFVAEPGLLASRTLEMLQRSQEMRADILQKFPQVRALSKANFA